MLTIQEKKAYFQTLMDQEDTPASLQHQSHTLKATWLDTQLGPMIAIADEHALYLLDFIERRHLKRNIARLKQRTKSTILSGYTQPIASIEKELQAYFEGQLTEFNVPLMLLGSPFQKRVWTALQTIPYGETRSYLDTAKHIDHPTAYRAVANANGNNQFAIVIPCHRVINTNGNLGGYAGGITRKQWLIAHEKK